MWKDIIGFEGKYQVNKYGHVKSLQREINGGGKPYTIYERILKPCLSGRGYPRVCLRKDGRTYEIYNHHIVANAFISKPDVGYRLVINHIDGNKINNYYTNLEWVSYSQNNQHAYDNGLYHSGEQHYKSKLTTSNVREIRLHGKQDLTYAEIGGKYGVAGSTIENVLNRKTWKSI